MTKSAHSPGSARTAIIIWLAMLLVSLGIISRSHFTADLSAFLPSHPTAEQQLLMDQLKDGLASRLILVGIDGADEQTRAALSKAMAQKLRSNPAFVSVNNGEDITSERDRTYLFSHRYLLSPAVTPERFSSEGLHAAISDSIDQIASPAGLLMKSLLPHDPTGEMLQLMDTMSGTSHPEMVEGAWASRDGKTALLLLQTSAAGSDTDAQKLAMQAIREEFDQALIEDAKAFELFLVEYPRTDVQQMRTLIRNAQKEQAANKPPKSSRELFKMIRDLAEGTANAPDEHAE